LPTSFPCSPLKGKLSSKMVRKELVHVTFCEHPLGLRATDPFSKALALRKSGHNRGQAR
jgi:hypothetical protein